MAERIGAVAIGRNEGERLIGCLASLQGQVDRIVYVDSGSNDGSVAAAREAGADVVELDLSVPFTAARARNAGWVHLTGIATGIEFIQFLDGDCELAPGWIENGLAALVGDAELAVVCGRRRERHPEASIWNKMVDAEWDSLVGEAKACGGDALMRHSALEQVGGYREDLIAGEEPEMCFRLRQLGWRIFRIDAEMTLHDADMTRVSQWWQRARRAGHTYAEGVALHGKSSEKYKVAETRRTIFWGVLIPLTAVLGAIFLTPGMLLVLGLWPLQMARLRTKGMAWKSAIFLTLAKLPEAQGAIGYWMGRFTGRRRGLIEYK